MCFYFYLCVCVYLSAYLSDNQVYDYLFMFELLRYDLSFLLMQSSFPKYINQFLNATFSSLK